MEAKEIIINNAVVAFLKKLTTTLYQKEYFGFLETTENYVNDLIDGMYAQLLNDKYHETPGELKHYGSYYLTVKGGKRTTWYVFFDKNENRYVIEFITNNHMPQSAYLNKL
ncbi:MAG: hypothetical protein QM640_00530 [Niabella sp.]